MADNISLLDAASATVVVKAKDNSSVFTPYQNMLLNDVTPSVNSGNVGTGVQRVVIATDQPQLNLIAAGATSIAKAEDVASADADVGVPAMAVRTAAPADRSGTEGDYEQLQMKDGLLWVRPLGLPFEAQTDITRPADTTAYAANDALSNSTSSPTSGGFTFTDVARVSGGSVLITDLKVATSNDPATTLQGDIFIFNQAVTNINDNAAFAVSDAEIKTCVAQIPFILSDVGNNGYQHIQNLAIMAKCVGTDDLRFLVRVRNVYTPANAEVITVTISGLRLD